MKKTIWDVSYELEGIVEKKIKARFDHSGTVFDRARIESDMFYDVMHLMLHMFGGEGTLEFQNKYYIYKKVNMNDIPNYQEIFEEFKQLLV